MKASGPDTGQTNSRPPFSCTHNTALNQEEVEGSSAVAQGYFVAFLIVAQVVQTSIVGPLEPLLPGMVRPLPCRVVYRCVYTG